MRRGLLVLCVFIAACRGGAHRIGYDAKPPVIIISIDTLRSDHLPMYGYKGVETPNLDAFRKDAILFERAYSHVPLTLPSHATILTGALPADHGLRDNMGYKLSKSVTTLPESLKARGYTTGGAVSTIVLRSETGINRGFDFWDDDIDVDTRYLSMGRVQRAGDDTRKVAEKWIGEHKAQPFFFLFHLYEPHSPYEPVEPFATKYGAQSYDGEIATADAIVGRFLDFLKSQELYDKSMIVILSDHGEGLNDHGESEHGLLLYREAIQVPLLVKLPGSDLKGTSVASTVQLTDVYPTVIAETGAKAGAAVHGASLLGDDIKKTRAIYSETYYPRFHYGWSDLHSIVSANDHYIHGPNPELFDLGKDPAEKTNTLQNNRRAYLSLRTQIGAFIKKASAPSNVDPEQAKQLAALGYVGSAASPSSEEELPDPRLHLDSAERMKAGYRAFQEEHYDEALKVFDEMLRENPKMLDIWSMKARSLVKLGREKEALEASKEALKLSPTTANLALIVANIALESGDYETAKHHAELAIHDEPGQAHYLLAEVAIEQKDVATAKREANLTLQTKRDGPLAMMMLGRIAKEEGNFAEALTRFDETLRVVKSQGHSPVPRLQYLRGDTLARLGRPEEAEAAFHEEIKEFPTEPAPYKNLILIYALQGRTDEATQLIFTLEQKSPTPPSYVAISEALKTVGDANGAKYWAAKGLQKYPTDAHLRSLLKG